METKQHAIKKNGSMRKSRRKLKKTLKSTDLDNELRIAWGKDRGRDSLGVWYGHVHTAIFKLDNQQGSAG